MIDYGKRIFLLLLVALLASLATTVNGYDAEKLYRYDFEATILTKVADDEKPQYSGVAMSSPLAVKRTGSSELTVKLERPQLATFNEIIDDLGSFKPSYRPIEQANSLDKAFRIYYEDGAVKSFDTYKDEPKWVTNFKRGLLSFFQLKLQEPKGTDASDKQESGAGQYYTTSEKSVFGECETDYLVLSSEADTSSESGLSAASNYLNVTKTRNMAKCKTRFFHRFMPIDSAECYDNERDLQQYKHSNAIFNFYLIGKQQDFSIKLATLNEVSTFSPFGQKAHSHMIHTKSQLRLNQIDSNGGSSLVIEDGATRIDSLSYDPPEMLNFYANVNLDDDHHLSNIYQSRASVDQVMGVFDALVQEHRAYTSSFESTSGEQPAGPSYLENSNLAQLFTKLNELVGTMNSQKIEQLYQQVDERGDAHKKIFWDLMSVVGTNPSFMFMKKLITEGEAPSVKIKDFLTRSSYHIKMPSKSLFDEYVNLCKSDKIQTNQQYKRLCSLPLASLIHQHCAKPHAKYLRQQQEGANNPQAYKKAQNTCQIATAEEYFSRLVGPLASTSGGSPVASSVSSGSADGSSELSIGDKMFNVKMAGELGVKPSIDYLMDIVRNRDEHPTLRAAAVWNLNKAARIYPAQVKRLVVPYYYDRGELLEVRIAAFYNWFYSGLSLHELETLAKQLADEPSRQLVVYIHSMMSSLADLQQIPCTHSSERNAKLVLPAIRQALKKHSPATMTDSRASMSSTWQQDFGYGTASLMSAIFSNESMAPSNLYYQTSEIMSGLKLSPMSISVQAHGLDKLIKRVVGINGLLADKESFMDVFSLKRRAKRQTTSADLIKQEAAEIDKELKLATREFSDVYVAVTISAYGRPIAFYDKDSRELKKMLSDDGTVKVPQIKKIIHSLNNHTQQQMMITFEKFEVFNNELGLPLYQSISDFDYKTFRLNNVKLDVEPGFFKDERQGKPPSKITGALDAKMGRHNEMYVATGALLVDSKQQVGVAFHKKKLVQVPLKMSFDVNLLENKVSIKRQPIHDNLLYIRQQPVTFVKSYEPSQALASVNGSSNEWKPLYELHNPAQMVTFKLDYMTPLAVGLRVEGRHRLGEDWSMAAWRRHLSSIGLQAAKFMYMYSPTGAPLEVRLGTATTAENPTKELTSVFAWRHQHADEYSTAQPASDNQQQLAIAGPETDSVHRDLESLTGKDQAGKPTTVDYRLALVGGSSKERRVAIDISYSRSFDRALHKWRAFYQRTPLDQAAPNSEVTNLCWLGQVNFPKMAIDKFLRFDLPTLDQSARLSSELTFGDECTESRVEDAPARLSLRAAFDWTKEQRSLIEAALGSTKSGDSSNSIGEPQLASKHAAYRRMYLRCAKNRESTGAQLDSVCVHLLLRMSELTHISANISYKDVPQRWTKLASRMGSLYTYARAGYIDEMDDKPAGRQYKSADGKADAAYLEANMTMGAHDRKLSYQFDTSNYHVLYKNLPVSVPPLSAFPLMGASYYQALQRGAGSRSCSVSQNQVTTFDNLTYTMPQVSDGCFKLITKDCSPEANFVVLGAKVGSGKVVKVYIAQKFKVEFVPDKDGKRISDIKVNGETVSIEPNKLPLSRETKMGPKTVDAFTIENNGAYYTLNSKLYKFSVSTDGTWIFVQQSKYYAGKSCGICGDANGDQLLEFKSPSSSKKVCKNTNDFVWSYVLPSTCASRPTTIECA